MKSKYDLTFRKIKLIVLFQEDRDSDHSSKKKKRNEDSTETVTHSDAPVVQNMISKDQIKAMMSQAKAHITQRKQDLQIKVSRSLSIIFKPAQKSV